MNKPLILAVEDDAPIRNLISTTLKTNDYRYQLASNGKEAILAVSTQNPDIVLLDLGLPDMDGVEATARFAPGHTFRLLSSAPEVRNGTKLKPWTRERTII